MATQPNTAVRLPRHLQAKQSFILDPDIALECEDRANASGHSWQEWLQETVNEALKAHLFG